MMHTDTKSHVLVTGGAGYIGSHVAKALAAEGHTPVTLDSMVRGNRWAIQWGPLVEADIADRASILETIRAYDIQSVIHLAAFGYVGESMRSPELYFENNVKKSLTMLDTLVEAGIKHVVFSSSCATYGIPEHVPIDEQTPQRPVNPYGETKLIFEKALRWYGMAHDFSWMALRYFNASGADAAGTLGEAHSPETHLIPLVIQAALGGKRVEVYGDDYATLDGSCVRDYIHVTDLADAHVRALQYLTGGGDSVAVNLGTGEGHSVKELIQAVAKIADRDVPHAVVPRRGGDPATLVADPSLSRKVLGWSPQHSGLENIVRTAWEWHSKAERQAADTELATT